MLTGNHQCTLLSHLGSWHSRKKHGRTCTARPPLATIRGQSHGSVKKKLGGEPRNIGIVFKNQENGLIEDMSVAVIGIVSKNQGNGLIEDMSVAVFLSTSAIV